MARREAGKGIRYSRESGSVVPAPAETASPGNLSEMQILTALLTGTKSETLG